MQTGNLNKLPLHFFLKSGLNTRSHTLKSFLTLIIYPVVISYYISLHQGWEHIITLFLMVANCLFKDSKQLNS